MLEEKVTELQSDVTTLKIKLQRKEELSEDVDKQSSNLDAFPALKASNEVLKNQISELTLEVNNLTELLVVEQEQNDAMSNEVKVKYFCINFISKLTLNIFKN